MSLTINKTIAPNKIISLVDLSPGQLFTLDTGITVVCMKTDDVLWVNTLRLNDGARRNLPGHTIVYPLVGMLDVKLA